MKISVIDKTAKKVSDYELNISESVREDIFKKAVTAESSIFRQKAGATPLAGKKSSINVSKRRQVLRSTYGKGGSRTPKKTMWKRGMQVRFVGAFVSQAVGGRRAHPPKASKNIVKEINNKEWLKALRIGITASMDKDIVSANGQKIPANYPFILDDTLEKVQKTKDIEEIFKTIGLDEEMQRLEIKKVRAGKGKMRNRTYKTKRGPLVVVSSADAPLLKASKNLENFEVIIPELLMVSDFGMSFRPGRAVIFTKSALDQFQEVLKEN